MAFSIVFFVFGLALAAEEKSVLLEVKLHSADSNKYELRLKLTNASPNSITIYDTDLPWIPPNQLVFVKRAYRMNSSRTLLEKFTPMEDYARIPNQLEPGASLSDTIDLNTMFPSLEADAKKYGVTIEWICRSKRVEFRCKEGKGGKFVVAKKQTKKDRQESSPPPPTPTITFTK